MKIGKTFVSGILAGISIAIGGLVFLSVENRVIGAALFTVGLFSVCSFGFHLFTGKVFSRMIRSMRSSFRSSGWEISSVQA